LLLKKPRRVSPQGGEIKRKSFFPAACTSEKILLAPQTCERSECAAAGRISFKKVVKPLF
jgi:hypothetical protein